MNNIARCMFQRNLYSLNKSTFIRLLSQQGTNTNFDELVKGKPIVVFMKGTPDAPRCGFSNAVCQILKVHGVEKFASYDVLSDDDLREGEQLSSKRVIPDSVVLVCVHYCY